MKSILQDDEICLRALEPTDLDILYEWENDTSLWDIGNTIAPYSREQLWEYLQGYDGDIYKSHQLRLMVVLKSSGESIGTIDFYDFDPFNSRAAIGILIAPQYQGKGYGKQALRLAKEYATEYVGLRQCVALIPIENTHSYKLFLSEGFSVSGIFKEWLRIGRRYVDVYIMQAFN
ncbi:MAG: GNAT family N-acetyltransferase [Muribaculaceae bacterium]|nr:GNAT family N-acetyltransferase [Muribaculaceae bacterium]